MGSDMINITEMHARCARAHEVEGLPQSVRDSLADVPHLLAAVIRLRGDLADRDCGIESALRICQIDSLRAAVRAADAFFAGWKAGNRMQWESAYAEYMADRAKCGEVT